MRLRQVCEDAARGTFPAPVWDVEFLPAPPRLAGAVLAFTGHHVIAADVDAREARSRFAADDIAAPFNPTFLAWLGTELQARVGHIDAVLAAFGAGGDGDSWLQPVADPPANERVERARAVRTGVTYFAPADAPDHAVVTLGAGLADRLEVSLEIAEEADRNHGLGRRLLEATLHRVPTDEAVFATVAPGNTRSLRCFLGAGFRPIGAECLLT